MKNKENDILKFKDFTSEAMYSKDEKGNMVRTLEFFKHHNPEVFVYAPMGEEKTKLYMGDNVWVLKDEDENIIATFCDSIEESIIRDFVNKLSK